jgi:cytochrome o ubiquinol oxidase subunit II
MVLAGLALGLGACSEGVLAPAGPIVAAEDQILMETFVAMMLVVVPVIGLILAFAWRYRASNKRARYQPNWAYSGKIEFSIWIIPLLLIVFLATLAWSGSHDLDPYKPISSSKRPVTVQVVSLDWKWLFIYPDYGVASLNDLAVPVGTPIHFELTSGTVMNSFLVPQLGSQIYTMAGMQTQLSLQADRPGDYRGLSAQFSGDGFSDMHFVVHARDDAGFAAWVSQARAAQTPLSPAVYQQLLSTHAAAQPQFYGAVTPGLFAQAVALGSHAPPGAAPSAPGAMAQMTMPTPSSAHAVGPVDHAR